MGLRMLDQSTEPTEQQIEQTLGPEAVGLLKEWEAGLNVNYDLNRSLRFPFGHHYGWGYKYAHRAKHLCYIFFETGSFAIMLQLGGSIKEKVDALIQECQPELQKAWDHRYPCGDGGWIQFSVTNRQELSDLLKLLAIKQKPIKKIGETKNDC